MCELNKMVSTLIQYFYGVQNERKKKRNDFENDTTLEI